MNEPMNIKIRSYISVAFDGPNGTYEAPGEMEFRLDRDINTSRINASIFSAHFPHVAANMISELAKSLIEIEGLNFISEPIIKPPPNASELKAQQADEVF